MTIEAAIRRRGGAAATHELAADGFGRGAIRAALRSGWIVRVRQGWYLEAARHPNLVEAARIGGRLTCGSALRLHGIWVVDDRRCLHVAVNPGACQLRHPHDRHRRLKLPAREVVVHWTGRSALGSRLIADPVEALADLVHCSTPELVAASAESLINSHPASRTRLMEFIASAPKRAARPLHEVDGRSESGTEFLFRYRISRVGIRPEPQVSIAGVGRVDFVIGDRLVIEVDGAEYHTDRAQFEADRRRDALLSARGYRVLRFSHRLVLDDWPTVEAAVCAAVVRGDHR